MRARTHIGLRLLLLLMSILLILPLAGLLLDRDSESAEKRALNVFPETELLTTDPIQWSHQFKAYFEDRFGFRTEMVRASYRFREALLGGSDFGPVVVGSEGWLYYQAEDVLPDYRGLKPFPKDQLDRIATNLLQEQADFNQRGIQYLVVIPPNKSTMYPEHLPTWMQRQFPANRLHQVADRMRTVPNSPLLDLRPMFEQEKTQSQVYYRTDTHWNDWGAFLAFRATVNELDSVFEASTIPTKSELSAKEELDFSGDLANLISQKGQRTETVRRYHLSSTASRTDKQFESLKGKRYYHFKGGNPKGPRLLLFQDSFGLAVDPFYASVCSEALFVASHGKNEAAIREFNPDVVIRQVVERQLYTLRDLGK